MRQPIRPGDVNWMIAGRGIVHSERTPQALRTSGSSAWGLQSWVALPESEEERAPSFRHHAQNELPSKSAAGAVVRVIAGNFMGLSSPVETLSPMFYADVSLDRGARLALVPEHDERGAYIVDGTVSVDGQSFERGQLLIFKADLDVDIEAASTLRMIVLGGRSLGTRHVWWNFVSSSRERIERAKEDWKAGRFGGVPGDAEFIPLPEDRRPRVDYP